MPRDNDHPPPHARNLREGRWSEAFGCYAITKCTDNRRPVLATPEAADILLASFKYLRDANQIRLMAFCIMPDHYHLLMFLLPGKTLRQLMESLGKYTARRLNQLFGRRGQFWQDEYHDHRCRDEQEIEERLLYIEYNPVRAGLVEDAAVWQYSSGNPAHAGLLDRDWYNRMR